MEDLIDYDQLRLAAKSCIKDDIERFRSEHPVERISGYAIGTDDDVITIGSATRTESYTDDELNFSPEEWPFESWVPAFQPVFDAFQERARLEDGLPLDEILIQRDRSVFAITNALIELKREDLIDNSVFLTVYSSDPSEHMQRLEDEVVQKLNSGNIVEQRNRIF